MTREEAKQLLPVIQAFAEGKAIEICSHGIWEDIHIESPYFDGGPSCYRIKPEPKYRPFKAKEECWKEMQNHQPFGWVKNKNNKDYYNIAGIYKIRSGSAKVSIDNCAYTLNEVFNLFTFTDGAPFGIKEE